jgi:uncharacterized protein (DUF952 family)
LPIVYKIVSADAWKAAETAGIFAGAGIDLADGYIHLSTAAQVRRTAERYFAGLSDLVLVGIDANKLGEALRYEASTGGDLFPHLYAHLALDAVLSVYPLPLSSDGRHVFPEDVA